MEAKTTHNAEVKSCHEQINKSHYALFFFVRSQAWGEKMFSEKLAENAIRTREWTSWASVYKTRKKCVKIFSLISEIRFNWTAERELASLRKKQNCSSVTAENSSRLELKLETRTREINKGEAPSPEAEVSHSEKYIEYVRPWTWSGLRFTIALERAGGIFWSDSDTQEWVMRRSGGCNTNKSIAELASRNSFSSSFTAN